MRNHDIYCAICGGPFSMLLKHFMPRSHSQNPWIPNAPTFAANHLSWLERLRIVGRNTTNGKAYVTGEGRATIYGWVEVDAGEDENVPNPELKIKIELPTYQDWLSARNEGDMFALYPVHCACLELAGRCFEYTNRKEGLGLDLEGMRMAMQEMDSGEMDCLGRMRYGKMAQRPGGKRIPKDEEVRARLVSIIRFRKDSIIKVDTCQPYLLDPLAHIELEFPDLEADKEGKSVSQCGSSLFTELATELLHQILINLDPQGRLNLLQAAPGLARRLSAHFWRQKILLDLPYLNEVEVRPFERVRDGDPTNWKALYRRLLKDSRPPVQVIAGEGLPEMTYTSIASRRRIWECLEQLVGR
ncbi:hypothetical protein LTR62_008367 [Meristemomyces frigidus]|uniref:F-box domain-containing protein n=1 Tax=Meristemomyces frigidus TaxID=1508187 RepID=A0AAN7YCV5_9PEZI|nr:hypothetical protein LTR62_008367 [Meristemomyces frigidus]